jgi:hypothetical protein
VAEQSDCRGYNSIADEGRRASWCPVLEEMNKQKQMGKEKGEGEGGK